MLSVRLVLVLRVLVRMLVRTVLSEVRHGGESTEEHVPSSWVAVAMELGNVWR